MRANMTICTIIWLVLFLCCLIMCLYVLSSVLWCPLRFPYKTMFDSSSPVFLYERSYLRYVCLFAYSGAQRILCCGFFILRLVYPTLPVSLDCPLVVVPSVFSKMYWTHLFLRRVLPEMLTFLRSKYLWTESQQLYHYQQKD